MHVSVLHKPAREKKYVFKAQTAHCRRAFIGKLNEKICHLTRRSHTPSTMVSMCIKKVPSILPISNTRTKLNLAFARNTVSFLTAHCVLDDMRQRRCPASRVANPHHFNANPDPDPASKNNADPNPASKNNADPDPASKSNSDSYRSGSATLPAPIPSATGCSLRFWRTFTGIPGLDLPEIVLPDGPLYGGRHAAGEDALSLSSLQQLRQLAQALSHLHKNTFTYLMQKYF